MSAMMTQVHGGAEPALKELIPCSQWNDHLPSPVTAKTLHKWCTVGVKITGTDQRVKLRCIRICGSRHSHPLWIREFAERAAGVFADEAQASSPKQRQREIEAADAEAARLLGE